MQYEIVILLLIFSHQVKCNENFGSDETPEGAAYIRSDLKEIIASQLQALDNSDQGIMDNALSVVDKLLKPFEDDVEELEKEATVLATDAWDEVGDFFIKYGAIATFLLLLVLAIVVSIICVLKYCRNSKLQEKVVKGLETV